MLRLKSAQDLGAAVLFALIGACGLWFGRDYPFGTPGRIGPGYVPALASWGLTGIGAVLALRSVALHGPKIEVSEWRPVLLVLASVLAFAGLIEFAGLAVT